MRSLCVTKRVSMCVSIHVCVLWGMLECAWTYMSVGCMESLRYVLMCLSLHVLCGKAERALCQPSGNSGWSFTEMQPSFQVMMASEGDSINITCSTRGDLEGIYLKQSWPQDSDVIYFEDGKESTVDKRFSGRIDFSGPQNNLTITMRLLRLADTGVYFCEAVRRSASRGSSTMVVVTGRKYVHLPLARPGARWLRGPSFHLLELSAQSLSVPGSILVTASQLLPWLLPGLSPKASSRVLSCLWLFLFIFPEKLSQEAYRSQEPLRISVSLPAALAVGSFFMGLVLGVLCTLRKTQVSVSLWLLPTSWPFSRADRRRERRLKAKGQGHMAKY